jgi:hypothetical protein
MEVSGLLQSPATSPLGERNPCNPWIGGWVGPRAGLDVVVKRKHPYTCRKSNSGRKINILVTILPDLPQMMMMMMINNEAVKNHVNIYETS